MGFWADWHRDQEEEDQEQIVLHRSGRCEPDRCPVCIAEPIEGALATLEGGEG